MRKTITKDGAVAGALRPNAGIEAEFVKAVTRQVTFMANDIRKELEAVFKETDFNSAMDASITSQARITLNYLLNKWKARFNIIAKSAVDRMIARTMKNSAVTLGMSLREVSKDFQIDTSFSDARLQEVIKASTQEAANLIKTIPVNYINEVQGQVMRSITTGQGLKDLVPYLTKKYQGNVRKAKNVALDQTRKAYQSINTSRLKSLGVKKFIWVHSGGGKEPRIEHIKMSGKEYSFDNPPIIGVMYGNEVRGLPGDLPNCRCICKPVITFDLEE